MSDLDDPERQRIRDNIAAIKQHPDLEETFKAFHQLGMVTGWRDIRRVCPLDAVPPIEGNVVCVNDLVLGSADDVLKRKH